MKKLFAILTCLLALNHVQLKAQPTDRPLNNFYVDPEKGNSLIYQYIFSDSLDNLNTIAKKIRRYFIKADCIADYTFDSVSSYVGHMKNIYIDYYGKNKCLYGDFVIDIKDGKYKLTIRNMVWRAPNANSNTTTVVYGLYGYGASGSTDTPLEQACLNKKGTKWESLAFNLLPDVNTELIKDFKLPVESKW